jgi:signal transduction histidine kinase
LRLPGRRHRDEEARDQALQERDSRILALERDAGEMSAFLGAAAAALSAGRSPTRVSEVLAAWAAVSRPGALDRRQAIAVAGPLAELIEEYRRLVGDEREILYIEDGGGAWLSASIDRDQFVRAIRELLDNVLRHAAGWRRITVTAEPVPGEIVVKVRDDGAGAADDFGLGLLLARRIAALHGGDLRLASEPGHGVTVSTWWPSAEAGGAAGATHRRRDLEGEIP